MLNRDENGHITRTYTDKSGLEVMSEEGKGSDMPCTRRVYDSNGRLHAILYSGELRSMKAYNKTQITQTRDYCGDFIFVDNAPSTVNCPGGYFDSEGKPNYRHTDWQGNVTMVTNSEGKIAQHTGYYPYGEPWSEPAGQPYLFGGKERLREGVLNEYDFGARRYNSALALWTTPDPKSVDYSSTNPYIYCGGNPIKYIDDNGKEWYRTNDNQVVWTTYKDQNELNAHNISGTHLGEAHVEFVGSRNERLGYKNGKYGYIDGEGAVTADVTVYGPGGEDDVHSMVGYTMTSDPVAYGAIDEGLYPANYVYPGKVGKLSSNWVLNAGLNVRMMDGGINPFSPNQIDANGEGYKLGIYIHSTNASGMAKLDPVNKGTDISVGCLLLAPKDFKAFNKIMKGVQKFTVQVTRSVIKISKDNKSTNGVIVSMELKRD